MLLVENLTKTYISKGEKVNALDAVVCREIIDNEFIQMVMRIFQALFLKTGQLLSYK